MKNRQKDYFMNNDRLKFRTPYYLPNPDGINEFVGFAHWDAISGRPNMMVVWDNDEQCTGLRDINGNLIYEGDIVRFVKQRGYYTQKGAIYTIEFGVFRFCGFGWRNCPEHDVEFALTESAAKKCEIIGNIHEQKDVE